LREVLYYKNNFEGDDQILSVSAYNALDASIKKYFEAVMSFVGVAGYQRSKEDFIASTNKIISFDLENVTGKFIKDEVIFKTNDTTNAAQVAWSSDESMNIQHVRGEFFSENSYTIRGERSGATATVVAESVTLLQNVIPPIEQVFYKPITIYEYEETLNEKRRNILLVDNAQVKRIDKQLTELLK
jgi:hypothetical protein